MRRAITFIIFTTIVRILFWVGGVDMFMRGEAAASALLGSILLGFVLTLFSLE